MDGLWQKSKFLTGKVEGAFASVRIPPPTRESLQGVTDEELMEQCGQFWFLFAAIRDGTEKELRFTRYEKPFSFTGELG